METSVKLVFVDVPRSICFVVSDAEVAGADDFSISDFCDDNEGRVVVKAAPVIEGFIVDDIKGVLIVGENVNEVVEPVFTSAILS